MSTHRSWLVRFLVTALMGPVTPVGAAEYSFQSIVDSSSGLTQFSGTAINSAGLIAFRAELTGGGEGVFIGGAGPLIPVADIGGSFLNLDDDSLSINIAGLVAFSASLDPGPCTSWGCEGVFAGDGELVLTIADGSGMFAGFNPGTAINDSGRVAFRAGKDMGGSGLFTKLGSEVTTIADVSGFLDSINGFSMNNAGTVAFRGAYFGGAGMYVGSGSGLATIADTSGPFSSIPGTPDINDRGEILFSASLDAGGSGVYLSSGGVNTPLVSSSGPFSTFADRPCINARGDVAFHATLDAGGSGIFTGDDPALHAVVRVGDPMFGSTISSIHATRFDFNNGGQIAFAYSLTNGTSGIAVATPHLSGDLNADGTVDGADLGLLLGAWGDCERSHPCPADLNEDGAVDGADLGLVLGAWTG